MSRIDRVIPTCALVLACSPRVDEASPAGASADAAVDAGVDAASVLSDAGADAPPDGDASSTRGGWCETDLPPQPLSKPETVIGGQDRHISSFRLSGGRILWLEGHRRRPAQPHLAHAERHVSAVTDGRGLPPPGPGLAFMMRQLGVTALPEHGSSTAQPT